MRVIGVMSGTSLDGIDVAIVDVAARGASIKIEPVVHHTVRYSKPVREAILSVSNTMTHTAAISRLTVLLGQLYASAIKETCRRKRVALKSIDLIGMHGQTIFHEPAAVDFLNHKVASTYQIGDPAVVAEQTSIDVISNFREPDIAAGGNGAPLVPFVDYLLFRDSRAGRIALNIGGIANITVIPPAAKPDQVIAFDTGPGNMIVDALVAKLTDGRQTFDKAGAIARKATVHEGLLKSMLSDAYFKKSPPKTTGRERFGQEFVSGLLATGIPMEELIATATEFTARSIAKAVEQSLKRASLKRSSRKIRWQVIASGGGVHNVHLMKRLADLLASIQMKSLHADGIGVETPGSFGIDPDAKEAIAFAVLAFQAHRRRPGNLPSATGARRSLILGRLTPASD